MKWWIPLLFVVGCAPHKPIIQRVVEKDTVIVTRERVLHDTLTVMKDTTIYQDSVIVQLQYINDRVVVSAKCPPQKLKVKTQTVILEPKKTFKDKLQDKLLWVLGLVLIILAGKKMLERLF